MKIVKFFALLFVITGAINWGLWGIFQYDLIADIFNGNTTFWARVFYSIIGFSGILGLSFFFVPGIYKCHCHEKKKDEPKPDEPKPKE